MKTITKENIHQVNYYELFDIARPSPSFHSHGAGSAPNRGAHENEILIDESDLRRRFRRYSLLFHPDKDSSPEAKAAFEYVRLALETLLDPALRASYEQELSSSEGEGPAGSSPFSRGMTSSHEKNSQHAAAAAAAAQEAADAEALLNERDAQQRAAREAQWRAAAEKEASAKRMAEELTHSADAPLHEIERALVREWNIDEELLQQKEKEVFQFLQQLQHLEEDGPYAPPPLKQKKVEKMEEREKRKSKRDVH